MKCRLEMQKSVIKFLKNNFFSSNAVQSLSHVLAMCDGEPENKCQKTMELFQKLEGSRT